MDQHQKITVYSAENKSGSLLFHIKNIIKELPESHELGLRLFKRNIKALYRQSLLGFMWVVFPPLVTAALWIFLKGNNVMGIADTDVPYPVFVLVGTMLWQVFNESIQAPLKNVQSNKAMLIKINIPREGLLLSGFYEVLFNLLIKIFLLSIIFIAFGQSLSISLIWVPIGILSTIICGFTIGLLLTPIGMLYTDVQKGLTVVLPFLMYLTPIVYPDPKGGIVGEFMKFNPMASIIPTTRDWFTSLPVDNLNLFILYSIGSVLFLFLALVIFRISMPMIIERAGS